MFVRLVYPEGGYVYVNPRFVQIVRQQSDKLKEGVATELWFAHDECLVVAGDVHEVVEILRGKD